MIPFNYTTTSWKRSIPRVRRMSCFYSRMFGIFYISPDIRVQHGLH
uniref:Uncharacterized protein n=1 Tax=Anguilla anguilla TaxID=7936 RepID=A0A0E9VGI2_ANGAN